MREPHGQKLEAAHETRDLRQVGEEGRDLGIPVRALDVAPVLEGTGHEEVEAIRLRGQRLSRIKVGRPRPFVRPEGPVAFDRHAHR